MVIEMKKRTKYTDMVTGLGSAENQGLSETQKSNNSRNTNTGNSWNTNIGSSWNENTNNSWNTNTGNSWNVNSNTGWDTNKSHDWSGFQNQQNNFETFSGRFGKERIRSRKRMNVSSLPIGGILKVGIILAIVVGIVFFLIQNSSLIAQGIIFIIEKIIYSALIALLLWGILNVFLKNVLPVKMQGFLFLTIFIISLIGMFLPEIGSALGILVFTVFGIVFLLYLLVK